MLQFTLSSTQSNVKTAKEIRCRERDSRTGQECTYSSKKSFNVKRHKELKHAHQGPEFTYYVHDAQHGTASHPLTTTHHPMSAAFGVTSGSSEPVPTALQHFANNIPVESNESAAFVQLGGGIPHASTCEAPSQVLAAPTPSSTMEEMPVFSPGLNGEGGSTSSASALFGNPADILALQSYASEDSILAVASSESVIPHASSANLLVSNSEITSSGPSTEDGVPACSNPSLTPAVPAADTADPQPGTISAAPTDQRDSRAAGKTQDLVSQHQDKEPRQASPDPELRRATRARFADPMPEYPIKLSKKHRQERALDWLFEDAKQSFEETRDSLLARWGVKGGHQGTCVQVPDGWLAADPIQLLDKFDGFNFPKDRSRAWYSYSDWSTSFVRARAWFDDKKWPRKGAELDKFLSTGPWQDMDASHLCHHGHCIIHIIYESAHINASRHVCCELARFLRQDGREVPALCDRHDPPCLMQHAALTTNETCRIQFAILREARSRPPAAIVPRPSRYPYPTMEQKLPCLFPAVDVAEDDLVHEAPYDRSPDKPDLICAFCSAPRAFASLIGLWGHLVHKHDEVGDSMRLGEVRRTAALWRLYGGKCGKPTLKKLEEVESESFSWTQILGWNLRR